MVECEDLEDTDVDVDYATQENDLMNMLYELARVRASIGHPMRRFQLSIDARGMPYYIDNNLLPTVSEESLDFSSADRQGFWHLAICTGKVQRFLRNSRQQIVVDIIRHSAGVDAELEAAHGMANACTDSGKLVQHVHQIVFLRRVVHINVRVFEVFAFDH